MPAPPVCEHVIRRRVEFAETDMAGIVHFSRYGTYMEAAEHDLFRAIGFSVVTEIDGERFGWPRVHAECDWRSPLRFEDEFEVRLLVREVRSKALVLDFVFRKITGPGADDRELVGHGSMTTVCVQVDENGRPHAVPIPDAVRDRIAPAPVETIAAWFPTRAD